MASGVGSSAFANRLDMTLTGHLTETALATAFAPLTARLQGSAGAHRLLIDCRAMTGYESAARALFVDWNRTHRARIARVAVVTNNRLYHMVVSAMSLASRTEMRAFSDPAGAERWLDEKVMSGV